ncbi:MAG: NADP-dependent oxidoreductase, partial [Sphingomonas sp.]
EHLDAALAMGKLHARFAICGMIDIYNDGKPTELRYLARLIGMRMTMKGLLVSDHMHRAAEFYRDMGGWLAAGKLNSEETVHDGLETMPDAFLGLFSGGNMGKMLVKV